VDQVLNSMARGWLLFGHWLTKEKFREQFLAALTTGTTVGPIVAWQESMQGKMMQLPEAFATRAGQAAVGPLAEVLDEEVKASGEELKRLYALARQKREQQQQAVAQQQAVQL